MVQRKLWNEISEQKLTNGRSISIVFVTFDWFNHSQLDNFIRKKISEHSRVPCKVRNIADWKIKGTSRGEEARNKPMLSAIMSFSGLGVSFMPSTIFLIGLRVFLAMMEEGMVPHDDRLLRCWLEMGSTCIITKQIKEDEISQDDEIWKWNRRDAF